ncbi:hypothetical protein K435DRAFT_830547 [Dendrothele bispora CBS 962.96]|uniref:Uncharacterized protein n=1 Tax=Dendrothele bispora (strain CBS 962.96) TaxID=1314807 RepID=A0A4S8LHW2_DENBC|nr:hypothetical protein K435DRAFT_830547 [Dendrothele bispora CBS 962.96]
MRLLLTGATGAAGSQILKDAVSDPAISSITVLARRNLPDWLTSTIPENNKTTTIIVNDFNSYPSDLPPKLVSHDACIWALGSTSAGKSEAEYTKITYDYVVTMIEALKAGDVAKVREETERKEPFRFVYVSGNGADQIEQTSRMFGRVKGRTEKYLFDLSSSLQILSYALRPGAFFPEDPKIWQNTRSTFERVLLTPLKPIISNFIPTRYIPVGELSRFALETAKGKWDNALGTGEGVDQHARVFSNQRMRELLVGRDEL